MPHHISANSLTYNRKHFPPALVTKSGHKTDYALKQGYIQCSPNPVNIHLSYDHTTSSYVVAGYNQDNRKVSYSYKKLSDARAKLALIGKQMS